METQSSQQIRKHTEGCRERMRWFLVCTYKDFSEIQLLFVIVH